MGQSGATDYDWRVVLTRRKMSGDVRAGVIKCATEQEALAVAQRKMVGSQTASVERRVKVHLNRPRRIHQARWEPFNG